MKTIFTLLLALYGTSSFAQDIFYYADRTSWQSSCEGEVTLEDFAGGPVASGNTGCDGDISAAGNSCFPAGEIQPGIIISASMDTAANPIVYTNVDFVSNPTPIVGSNNYDEYTIVSFPDGVINRVGLDLYGAPMANTMHVRVFAGTDLIDTLTITDGMPGPYFFGIFSSIPITSLEFQAEGFSVELVGMVEFGSCNVIATDDLINNNFAFYPNPVLNTLMVGADEKIRSIEILNLLGQAVITKAPNANKTIIDVAGLKSGAYLMKVQIEGKTRMYKLLKE